MALNRGWFRQARTFECAQYTGDNVAEIVQWVAGVSGRVRVHTLKNGDIRIMYRNHCMALCAPGGWVMAYRDGMGESTSFTAYTPEEFAEKLIPVGEASDVPER